MKLGKQIPCSHLVPDTDEAAIFLAVHPEVQISWIHLVQPTRAAITDWNAIRVIFHHSSGSMVWIASPSCAMK